MIRAICLTGLLLVLASATHADDAYDPLKLPSGGQLLNETLSVHDAARKRDLPIRVYRLAETKAAPVVVFSHGLGGSRDGSKYLGEHWARRGYVAVFIQHPGSDEAVWKSAPLAGRMQAMREAASADNLFLRAQDIPALLDQLETWTGEASHALSGTMNLKKVGMSGHSFGAQTTQAVAGQSFPVVQRKFTDSRIAAAVIMSPGSPPIGVEKSFAGVSIPWLLMTGTNDVSPIGGQTIETRLAVFPALPAGHKYELVLDQAAHSVFTDQSLRGRSVERNPNHHKVILATSTAFWDTYLRGDAAAQKWLTGPTTGPGPRSVMERADRWQSK